MPPTIQPRPKTVCPHCWLQFDPLDVLAIASHASLRGDLRAGADEMMRFPPSSFAVDGTPLDPRGRPAPLMACPHCHLQVPEALLTLEPVFVSILGSPGCGKSFFLTAMTWHARRLMPAAFSLNFADADPALNATLTEYEKAVFLSAAPGRPIPLGNLIAKTQLEGLGLYSAVTYADHSVRYPRPFMFTLRPGSVHPGSNMSPLLLCLYDNAGEQFLPGADSAAAPVTQHLARAAFLFYLFDPTMDVRFRQFYQLGAVGNASQRQELVLAEALSRVRRLKALPPTARDGRPLVIVLTKADVWGPKLAPGWEQEPWSTGEGGGLDLNRARARSDAIRTLLARACPEFVRMADEFSPTVTYVPTSAIGTARLDVAGGVSTVRPQDIQPTGVLVPLLVGLSQTVDRLVPLRRAETAPAGSDWWESDGVESKRPAPGATRP